MDRRQRAIDGLVEQGWAVLPIRGETETDLAHASHEGVMITVTPSRVVVWDGETKLTQYSVADWDAARQFAAGYHLGISRATSPAPGR